jgi:hypothetical protein
MSLLDKFLSLGDKFANNSEENKAAKPDRLPAIRKASFGTFNLTVLYTKA